MFCTNCGTQFEGKFCPECGQAVGNNVNGKNASKEDSQEIEELKILRDVRDIFNKLIDYNTQVVHEQMNQHMLESSLNQARARLHEIESKSEVSVGKAALAAYTLGVSAIFTGMKSKSKQQEKEIAIQKQQEIIDKLQRQIDEGTAGLNKIYAKAKELLESDNWKRAKMRIADEYLNYDAVPLLIEYLTYGRASSWKEAINLYEDQQFKNRMIDIGTQQLSVQNELLEAQNELIDISLKNLEIQQEQLDMQRILVRKVYETNDILKRQSEEMRKIRKNTRQTTTAACLSAFISALSIIA